MGMLGTIVGFVIEAIRTVIDFLFGAEPPASDDIILNPFWIWMFLIMWFVLIAKFIGLATKSFDSQTSSKDKNKIAGLDLDVSKLIQAKKQEKNQQPKKDQNFQPDRVK